MTAQEGVSLYHHNDVEKAATAFEAAAKLDGSIPTIQLNLGFANLALYQQNPKGPRATEVSSKAIVAFEKYLALRPNEERARVFLIQTFVDTGRYDDAVAFFKPSVEKVPADGEALNTLGIIASKTGRYDEAKGWYEKRVALDPNNSDARLSLGILLWDRLHNHAEIVGADRVVLADLAIDHLAEAIHQKPNAPNAYVYTNLVYRERAAGEPDDDRKRADIELAIKFHKEAQELQKGLKLEPQKGGKK
jgi:tetratricopeptide (TPR) repeat protein